MNKGTIIQSCLKYKRTEILTKYLAIKNYRHSVIQIMLLEFVLQEKVLRMKSMHIKQRYDIFLDMAIKSISKSKNELKYASSQ